jgi:hypothetical protein
VPESIGDEEPGEAEGPDSDAAATEDGDRASRFAGKEDAP